MKRKNNRKTSSNVVEKQLYHYTSRYQAEQIIEAGYLELTPSNLIKPTDLRTVRYEDGNYGTVSEISDPVKPVVWMTDSLDGSEEYTKNPELKQRIRISIPMKESYKFWVVWAKKNRMNKQWFKDFTQNSRYGTWYISEDAIPLEDVLMIEDLTTGEVLWGNPLQSSL
ncbi:MAG: hypothetical protein ABGU93_08030 [Acetobacterium sp.]|uniref:hypothetical protein n=1 Tax=Acetobacterium sp. TaxID=1872094 RepID=UPI0032421967